MITKLNCMKNLSNLASFSRDTYNNMYVQNQDMYIQNQVISPLFQNKLDDRRHNIYASHIVRKTPNCIDID